MIDPVIFSFEIGAFTFALRWYGVLVMFGVLVGAIVAAKQIEWRGGDPDVLWDAMMWLLPAGVIGARLWYVGNSIAGGNDYYLQQPLQILNIPQGGLHFFGGLLAGAATLYVYLKNKKLDFWLFLDSIAPAALLGQALARPANYINQELYGPPTSLPWGIKIDGGHRLAQFADLQVYPVATTRFHPTFAYEMLWNLIGFGVIMLILYKMGGNKKPGLAFVLWLVVAGAGRTIVEFFRPDQPVLAAGWLTTSMLVSFLMAIAGLILLLGKAGKLRAAGKIFPANYQVRE